jgi:hypothetical protein
MLPGGGASGSGSGVDMDGVKGTCCTGKEAGMAKLDASEEGSREESRRVQAKHRPEVALTATKQAIKKAGKAVEIPQVWFCHVTN